MLHFGMPKRVGEARCRQAHAPHLFFFFSLMETVTRSPWVFLLHYNWLHYNWNELFKAVDTSRSRPRYTPAMQTCSLARNIGS